MVNRKEYYNKRFKNKARAIVDELGMEDEQIEYFMLLPMSDEELYNLALQIKKEVEETEEHLKICKGCVKCSKESPKTET